MLIFIWEGDWYGVFLLMWKYLMIMCLDYGKEMIFLFLNLSNCK